MTPNVKNVVIDGLIFAGKTTAIQHLKARLLSSTETTFNFFEEPVKSWMSEGWLEKYYSNISKFASSFQMRIRCGALAGRAQTPAGPRGAGGCAAQLSRSADGARQRARLRAGCRRIKPQRAAG